jgi:hypothetical protein
MGVDQEHVTVEMWMDGTPLGHMFFDGATAEKHIHDMARHRAALSDPVAPDLDPGARLEAQIDPAWRIPPYRYPQGRLLCLRHPGLGWLSFVLPDKESQAIAEWLTKDCRFNQKPNDPIHHTRLSFGYRIG